MNQEQYEIVSKVVAQSRKLLDQMVQSLERQHPQIAAGSVEQMVAIVPDLSIECGEFWDAQSRHLKRYGPLDLSGADFTAALFAGLNLPLLERANLREAKLARSRWCFSKLEHADLAGADLRESYILGLSCGGSSFRGANLSGAWLSLNPSNAQADFTGANLAGATLTVHHTMSMIFTNADLTGLLVRCGQYGDEQSRGFIKSGYEELMRNLSERQRAQVRIDIPRAVLGH